METKLIDLVLALEYGYKACNLGHSLLHAKGLFIALYTAPEVDQKDTHQIIKNNVPKGGD